MNYQELAKLIIDKVGGEENVKSLNHCATRLRFNLKDDQKPDEQALKSTSGIMGVVNKGGQYQVIIGSDVGNVYKEITKQTNISNEGEETKEEDKRSTFAKVIDTITGIFTPILPAITAAGMLKAVLSVLVVFNVLTTESQSYQVINFMADAAFYFLPILLAASSAQKFKTNMYLAIMVGGILLHPAFVTMVNTVKESGGSIHLLGLPISAVSYSSSVIPIILSVWFMSYVEPIADKISPKAIKFFSKPLITIFVVGTVSLVVLGPIGYLISDAISKGITTLESVSPWIVPLLVGTFSPLLVATGTHYGLVPIGINNRMTTGYDTVIYPGMLASNVSQGAAAIGVGIKSKDTKIKQLAYSAGLTGLFGITEPALYGVNLRFKTPLYAAMIGGGVGGLFLGIFRVRNFSGGSPGLLTLPSYIGDNTLSFFYYACIGAVISIIVTFIATLILYKDPVVEETSEPAKSVTKESLPLNGATVLSPMQGSLHSLKYVEDGMFSEEILGQGVAIEPSEGTVVSPINGTVSAVFDSKHAIGLTSEEGIEILIHIGIDTVQLNGEGYEYFIQKGQEVRIGDKLIEFDLESIKSKGYKIVTPIVITNSAEVGEILTANEDAIKYGEEIIKIIK
ncbi:beta-glucoside-specific PTS transporter subunit IIABC [Niallia taxi]|uniref:PTS beta-glucoside transporter subunit EIIBCA n=1 Tax=Niallia taxi TaxID=2499688 RepID=A0A3S2X5J9_9BACI|nr:beta-glucoside-specific PTS transporter subunit IIABC [Niallia taxi]MDK8643174.1 beta-glucoside-specific PTS transporter subunit IIABC [Niallia taxi]MED4054650.1 beta-glucoside-specific PTS transporter subunit IIABC [Niallia taxi]MED4121861.1 beta-glucoside-specific PTS transporter subunit IIABC [Niallia taxi]RVT57458.1 PTS beta-glucoside transporter subunit EIIBCA [Niallia taxi]